MRTGYQHLGKDYCKLEPGQQRCAAQYNDVRHNFMWDNQPLPRGVTKLHSIGIYPCLLPEGHDEGEEGTGHLSDPRGGRIAWRLEPIGDDDD